MVIFSSKYFDNHEKVILHTDQETGLQCIVAIHNTNLGPALGGTRIWSYSSEEEALNDALRLSKGMTYKSALADVPFGGGKAVILEKSKDSKSKDALRAYGRFIDTLSGEFSTGEDVGMSEALVDIIREETKHVLGSSSGVGDPAFFTALGVLQGIKAAAKHRLGRDHLEDLWVAVQGVGSVGKHLCKLLHEEHAQLMVTDINRDAIDFVMDEYCANFVKPDAIYDADVDVLSPCALGAIINEETIPRIKASIIAGSANNQLHLDSDGEELKNRNILYAPDYVINSGGLIAVAAEMLEEDYGQIEADVLQIEDTLAHIFDKSAIEDLPTNTVANELAEEKFKK